MCTTGKEITFPWLSTQLPIRPEGAYRHAQEALSLINSSAYIHCVKIKILSEGRITIIYVHGVTVVLCNNANVYEIAFKSKNKNK